MLAFQFLFLAVYDIFLKRETFHNLNRIYLLIAPILGIILPLIRLSYIQQNIPKEYLVQLPTVLIGNTISEGVANNSSFWLPSLLDVYLLGIVFSVLFFSWNFFKIAKLKYSKKAETFSDFKLITLPKTDAAFSFFNTIFLGENISEENKRSILAHEKIHIQQKHTLDLLIFEILRIVFWFNPLIYLFQSRISALHEYIADEKVTVQKDKKEYYQNLLSQVFQTDKISFINTFFNHSLIKKRIIMLQKSKSRNILQLKYMLLVPIICGMLVYTSCSDESKAPELSTVPKFDSEVLTKINELGVAISKQGEMTPKEERALKHLTMAAQPGFYASRQEYLDDKDMLPIPFGTIERVPLYPGCSGEDNEDMKRCMSDNISEFVNNNFNTKLGKQLNLLGQQRISVQFKIDKTGKIVDVRARAKSPELEIEAVRVVSMLPQMQPGEQKGKRVGVLYSMPIVFDVQ